MPILKATLKTPCQLISNQIVQHSWGRNDNDLDRHVNSATTSSAHGLDKLGE